MFDVEKKRFKVEKVVFYNKENKWGILAANPLSNLGELEISLMNKYGNISVSGNFEGVFEGCEIELTGNVIENSRYGKQIQIIFVKVIQDLKNKESIINFLAKSVIKGISIQNAKKIYETFKDKAIDVVLNNSDKLIEINGIGEKTLKKVKESVIYYKSIEDLVKFGTEVGLSYYIINKLHEELGDEALNIIKEDPFKILEISQIITFKQVDEIYLKCGGDPLGERRIEVGLLYTLKQNAMLEGSTGTNISSLMNKFYKLLTLNEDNVFFKKLIISLEEKDKIYIDKNKQIVYYKEYLDIERNISEKIKTLNKFGIKGNKIKQDIVEKEINNFPFKLNTQQIDAINKCLSSNVAVLSGGAGCVSADTMITINRGGRTQNVTIKELFIKFKSLNKLQKTYVRSYTEDKNIIKLNEIKDVVHTGNREVYELILENNIKIKVTKSHEIKTLVGYKQLQKLKVNEDLVMVNLNKRERNPKYYKVLEIKHIGIEDTYDICCYKDHNFVGNNIVLHNSGKTTITKALYNIYSQCGFDVILLSPTAKACRRLEECTGGVAQTIHKFLGMKDDGEITNYNSFNNSVFIIDESSMMDIILFNHLLNRMTLTSRILLVGDNNQLPSVQAGNVLGDLIDSHEVNASFLVDVMRQKEKSSIIKYCEKINKGFVFDPIELKDFHYEEFGTGEELREFFVKKYLEEVKNNNLSEVQVITPYKKGELGMNNLNTILQEAYNKDGKILKEPYRLGDRVRHTQNNYKKEVYNGEVGIVTGLTEDEELIVDYGNKIILYDNTDIEELTLSYCSTVHASQGSEYEVCFVILDDTAVNTLLFIRRLLYTAVSRGKKKVYILTKPYIVDHCIENNNYRPRITKLEEFLKYT